MPESYGKRDSTTSNNTEPQISRIDALPATYNNPFFDSILNAIEISYVTFINEYSKSDLLKFYQKTHQEYKADSIIYFRGINKFFKSDLSIVSYLISNFINDSTSCSWVPSGNPLSSTIKKWQFTLTKREGAVVLIYSYFMNEKYKLKNSIIASPGLVESIIEKIKISDIKIWFEKNRSNSLDVLRNKFVEEFSI